MANPDRVSVVFELTSEITNSFHEKNIELRDAISAALIAAALGWVQWDGDEEGFLKIAKAHWDITMQGLRGGGFVLVTHPHPENTTS